MLVTHGVIAYYRSQMVTHPKTSYNEHNLTLVQLGKYRVHYAMPWTETNFINNLSEIYTF